MISHRTPKLVGWTCRGSRMRLFFFTCTCTLKSKAKVKCDFVITKKKLLLLAWLKAGFINLPIYSSLFVLFFIHLWIRQNLWQLCQLMSSYRAYAKYFFHMYRKSVILYQNLDSVKSKLICIYENYYRFSSMSSVEMVLGESD